MANHRLDPSGRQIHVSITEVAKRARVSNSTASYALNGGPRGVSPERRARVLAAAEELGYSANSLARSLLSGRSHTIGVLSHRLDALFCAQMLSGIAEVFEQRRYQMLVIAHASDEDRAMAALRDMRSRRLDGILSLATSANILPVIGEQVPLLGVPFVFAYQEPKDLDRVDCAIVDQVQGGLLATEHLLRRGCQRVAYVGGPLSRRVTTHRLEGYLRAHEAFHRSADEDLIVLGRDFLVDDGMAAGEALLKKRPLPDGVFAASDGLAAGILRVLRRAGIRMPDDIPIVGFDNSDAAALVDPPLTSVDMPMEELGRAAATRLIDHIEAEGEWGTQAIRLPCRLIVRDSA